MGADLLIYKNLTFRFKHNLTCSTQSGELLYNFPKLGGWSW